MIFTIVVERNILDVFLSFNKDQIRHNNEPYLNFLEFIDFKNNSLIQKQINEPVSEAITVEFNSFCKEQIFQCNPIRRSRAACHSFNRPTDANQKRICLC